MENEQNPQAEHHRQGEPFASDAKKLADKHLADRNHVITDEEMAKIRIGATALPDEPTQQAIDEAGERVADRKTTDEDKTLPGSQTITPWDVVD